jgi:thioredoxin reductase (NADPH)
MTAKKEGKAPFLPQEARKILKRDFSQLENPVSVVVFTDDTSKENRPFGEFAIGFLKELAEITEKIRPVIEKVAGETAKKYGISRAPVILIEPEKYSIRFIGAPGGEEAQTLIIALIMASTGRTILSEEAKKRLGELKERRNIKVFVSPTCPYCPHQAATAIAAAIEKPGLVEAEIIEIYENRDLATQYNAFSVPQTFIDDQLVGLGLQPQEVIIEELLTAAPVKPLPAEYGERVEKDLVIMGAGPAGLTAAIYAERSGLRSVVLEKANIGGQVSITPVVENYPGFTRIAGKTLMDMMAQQAITYADIHEGEEVLDVRRTDDTFEVVTDRTKYIAKAVLITTGAESRKLGIPGEREFFGRGVSYCASCDGYFFKDNKKVIVVGGGNTAATEALYLKNIGADVTIVHRRDALRCEQVLRRSIEDNRIPILWKTVVKEILGERLVTGVVLENTSDGSRRTLPIEGVFIAIGYVPNNEIAINLGVEVDKEGYLKVDERYRTNIKGIYAAGDITGGFKQIVTAVGQGAVAANTIFEDTSNPYWKEVKTQERGNRRLDP